MTDLRSLGVCPMAIVVTLLVVAALSTGIGVAGLLHHAWRSRQERRLVDRARRDEMRPPPAEVRETVRRSSHDLAAAIEREREVLRKERK